MLTDRASDSKWNSPLRRHKTVGIWAEIMHNFARILMLDVYALPRPQIEFWQALHEKGMLKRPLFDLGEWVLKFHLQTDPTLMEPELDDLTFGVSAEQGGDWDEMPGSFPTQSARPGASVNASLEMEMELSSDSNRWIIGEALASTTCKSHSKKKDLSQLAYRCNDNKKCPR